MAKGRKRNKRSTELEIARTIERFKTIRLGLIVIGSVLGIAAVAVPLLVLGSIVKSVAGETTVLEVAVKIGIVTSVGFGLALTLTSGKIVQQRRAIRRMRARTDELEKLLQKARDDQ